MPGATFWPMDGLLLECARNRCAYWNAALLSARRSGDALRIAECERFVQHYFSLIGQMMAAADFKLTVTS